MKSFGNFAEDGERLGEGGGGGGYSCTALKCRKLDFIEEGGGRAGPSYTIHTLPVMKIFLHTITTYICSLTDYRNFLFYSPQEFL